MQRDVFSNAAREYDSVLLFDSFPTDIVLDLAKVLDLGIVIAAGRISSLLLYLAPDRGRGFFPACQVWSLSSFEMGCSVWRKS